MSKHPKSIGPRVLALAAAIALGAPAFIPANTQAALRIAAERVAGGFILPLYVVAPPGDTSRIFVVQKTGEIFIVNLPSGVVNPTPFLDIHARVESSGNEQGLLGLDRKSVV